MRDPRRDLPEYGDVGAGTGRERPDLTLQAEQSGRGRRACGRYVAEGYAQAEILRHDMRQPEHRTAVEGSQGQVGANHVRREQLPERLPGHRKGKVAPAVGCVEHHSASPGRADLGQDGAVGTKDRPARAVKDMAEDIPRAQEVGDLPRTPRRIGDVHHHGTTERLRHLEGRPQRGKAEGANDAPALTNF